MQVIIRYPDGREFGCEDTDFFGREIADGKTHNELGAEILRCMDGSAYERTDEARAALSGRQAEKRQAREQAKAERESAKEEGASEAGSADPPRASSPESTTPARSRER